MKALSNWVIIKAVKPEQVGSIIVPGNARHTNAKFYVEDIGPDVTAKIAVGDQLILPDTWHGISVDKPDEFTEFLAARSEDLVGVL